MTTIGMNYEVIAGKEREFEQGFTAVLEHLKQVPGHVASRLYQDVAEPGTYLIFSQWTTRESFQAFIQSPAFRNTVAWGKTEILRSRPRHQVYQNA